MFLGGGGGGGTVFVLCRSGLLGLGLCSIVIVVVVMVVVVVVVVVSECIFVLDDITCGLRETSFLNVQRESKYQSVYVQ